MSKAEFIRKYQSDHAFRADAKAKGIRVIQSNVVFCNADGSVRAVAGNYIK